MSRQLGPAGWRAMWAKFDRRCYVYWLRKRWTLVLLHDRDVIALFLKNLGLGGVGPSYTFHPCDSKCFHRSKLFRNSLETTLSLYIYINL